MQFVTRNYHRHFASKNEDTLFKKGISQKYNFCSESVKETFFKPTNVFAPKQNLQRKYAADEIGKKQVQSFDDKNQENKLQKQETGSSNTVVQSASPFINSLNGKGNHLPKQDIQFFSSRMGYDFSGVKIHTDKSAADSAKAVNAKAYTIGNNIVFNEGQYNTESAEGKRLMAHELTHIVQQNLRLNKLYRYKITEYGDSAPARIQEVKIAMDGAGIILQRAIRAIQSIAINGEKDINSPVATALKALFHCPNPENIQAILVNFQHVQQHFNSLQQLIINYKTLPHEALYDENLHTITVSKSFFELNNPQKSLALLSRIIIPLYYMKTTVMGTDFYNFSIPGQRMVDNEFSLEMFLSFIEKPYSMEGFGSIPCQQTVVRPSELNLSYTNTGFYVLVPRIITSDTYLRRLTGYESPRKGDRVGELLRDRFGRFIFYRSTRIYVNQNNKVIFPF